MEREVSRKVHDFISNSISVINSSLDYHFHDNYFLSTIWVQGGAMDHLETNVCINHFDKRDVRSV